MKNRRFIIIAFVLVSALVMGIGYAALSDTLTIGGNIEIHRNSSNEALNQDICFVASPTIELLDKSGAVISTPQSAVFNIVFDNSDTSNDTLTFTAEGALTEVGQRIRITAPIENTGLHADSDATLSISVPSATGDSYLRAHSKNFYQEDGTTPLTSNILAAGEKAVLVIEFEYHTIVTDNSTCTVTYEIVATVPDPAP